jgi:HEPN domain-containing protein
MRKEIEIWWKQAERDFKAAEKNFRLGEWYVVAFLCQQAVERGLKALVFKNTKNPEKLIARHSLIYLGKVVNAPSKFFPALRELTSDYIVSRYPGVGSAEEPPYQLYDETKARKLLEKTKEILLWIRKRLK